MPKHQHTVEVDETHGFPAAEFNVSFGEKGDERTYTVTLSEDYYQKLTNGSIDPDELIRRAFAFLLERESPDEIYTEFDLTVIKMYFPEFEEKIRDNVSAQ